MTASSAGSARVADIMHLRSTDEHPRRVRHAHPVGREDKADEGRQLILKDVSL